jgi:peroxiredoxin
MVIVYRGKHCPVCKNYLGGFMEIQQNFAEANTDVVVISGDPEEKAQADVDEFGWDFAVGYGLSQDQMRDLGLYISEPRSEAETDRPFPEPGLFVVNPEGKVQVVDISNAPWTRPDLARVANGLKYVQANNYPIRGTLA